MHLLTHEMMTRSPTLTLVHSGPTSVTTPTPSCPRIRPGSTAGTSPLRMCRSVPQIVVVSALTITSVGSWMHGSPTLSQDRCPGPPNTSAFMPAHVTTPALPHRFRVARHGRPVLAPPRLGGLHERGADAGATVRGGGREVLDLQPRGEEVGVVEELGRELGVVRAHVAVDA